jgi:hypothetical protein
MPILIRKGLESYTVSPSDFAKESQLEDVLADFPDLLLEDEETHIRLVARQLTLPDAGKLDLLFVDSEGLPIAVEVKLARNAQSRREVVAQAIDYVSSLTALTVDELNIRVNGKLELALRSLTDGDASEFDLIWQSVGTNLRAGRARIVVVLDEAPPDLQRIFRFLANNSQLDVQLAVMQEYSSPEVATVFVPQILVSPASADRPSQVKSEEPHPELVAIIAAYNASVPEGIKARGNASDYRLIRPSEWMGTKLAYAFLWKAGKIVIDLHVSRKISLDAAEPFAPILAQFAGRSLAEGQGKIAWDKDYRAGRGRLFVEFSLTTPTEIIVQAMRDLITLTRGAVAEKLKPHE